MDVSKKSHRVQGIELRERIVEDTQALRQKVMAYMAHRVLATHQDTTRNALIANASMLTAFGIGDYMQKHLARYYSYDSHLADICLCIGFVEMHHDAAS